MSDAHAILSKELRGSCLPPVDVFEKCLFRAAAAAASGNFQACRSDRSPRCGQHHDDHRVSHAFDVSYQMRREHDRAAGQRDLLDEKSSSCAASDRVEALKSARRAGSTRGCVPGRSRSAAGHSGPSKDRESSRRAELKAFHQMRHLGFVPLRMQRADKAQALRGRHPSRQIALLRDITDAAPRARDPASYRRKPETSRPIPEVALKWPTSNFSSVDFPAPFEPSSPQTTPCGTSRETASTARIFPKSARQIAGFDYIHGFSNFQGVHRLAVDFGDFGLGHPKTSQPRWIGFSNKGRDDPVAFAAGRFRGLGADERALSLALINHALVFQFQVRPRHGIGIDGQVERSWLN